MDIGHVLHLFVDVTLNTSCKVYYNGYYQLYSLIYITYIYFSSVYIIFPKQKTKLLSSCRHELIPGLIWYLCM